MVLVHDFGYRPGVLNTGNDVISHLSTGLASVAKML